MQHLRAQHRALRLLNSIAAAAGHQQQQWISVSAPAQAVVQQLSSHGRCQQPGPLRLFSAVPALLQLQQHTLATRSNTQLSSSRLHDAHVHLPCTDQQQHRQQHPVIPAHHNLQQQQLRCYSDDASRRRLLAAQQRREREQELQKKRAAAATAALPAEQQQQQIQPEQAAAAAPPPAAGGSHAITPVEAHPSEVQLSDLLGHDALVVTRSIEWGTVILGFEQATKYTVYDQDGTPVALIAEEISGIGNEIQRQLLRTRRSFTSTVLSADGSRVMFRVRRPAYLLNSYMYIEDPEGEVVGEVRQRWHLWKRNYDLYLGRRQFAAINGGFLAWEFELKDGQGNTLALIDRNFLGFAKEIFTDAGKYVVHFGYSPQEAATLCSKTLQARSGNADVAVTPLAQARTEVAVIPSVTGNQLVVHQPLALSERMVALAAAISVDYNFFSQHSSGGGLISPPLFMPVPLPGGGMGGGEAAAGGAAADGVAGGGAAAGAAGGEAAGAAGAAPSAAGLDQPPPAGFGGDDAGFSSGMGTQQQPGFGDEAESFRWDTGSSSSSSEAGGGDSGGWGFGGGEGGGGDEEGASGLWGLVVGLWAMIFGE
uniref:Phospholipid scramblase n=1 Tax=Tetradesmus obliquus TaxID=3088 RepID=A0A383V788_TETOB